MFRDDAINYCLLSRSVVMMFRTRLSNAVAMALSSPCGNSENAVQASHGSFSTNLPCTAMKWDEFQGCSRPTRPSRRCLRRDAPRRKRTTATTAAGAFEGGNCCCSAAQTHERTNRDVKRQNFNMSMMASVEKPPAASGLRTHQNKRHVVAAFDAELAR